MFNAETDDDVFYFSNPQSTRHLFTPADRRIPRIRIETRQASSLVGQRIIVTIDGWPRNSRYPNVSIVSGLGLRQKCYLYPSSCSIYIPLSVFLHWSDFCPSQGHFVRNLGGAGDKETETEVLLLEHDVPHQPFSQTVLSFLPKMPWSVTEEVKHNHNSRSSALLISTISF